MAGSERTRVLVTGGTGLIGWHLVDRLVADYDVHVTTRIPRQDFGQPVTPWVIDLTDVEATARLIDEIRPDAICHLAGLVDGRASLDLVMPTLMTNLVATVGILEAATRTGCSRVVVAGSALDHSALSGAEPLPPSPYSAARLASSSYARMFHALFATPVVVLRPSYVYGPHQSDVTKLVPHIVTSLLDDVSVPLTSGERVVDWLYAGDAAESFKAALTAREVEGRTLDVASGDARTVREVAEMIHDIVAPPTARLEFGGVPTRPRETELIGDINDARDALGWSPATSLADGLERTVDWFRHAHPA